MPTCVTDIDSGVTEYRLNLLGVRVWKNTCQLIGRHGARWFAMGPRWQLPVRLENFQNIPGSAQSLSNTVDQFCAAWPDAGLAEILAGCVAPSAPEKRRRPQGLSAGENLPDARNMRLIASSRALLQRSQKLLHGHSEEKV